MSLNLDLVDEMKHSPVHNYAIPGLTSWLIGNPGPKGCVRLFECSRAHEEPLIPHSHRFDFTCLVLSGMVNNVLWRQSDSPEADEYQITHQQYDGEIGGYLLSAGVTERFKRREEYHREGQMYSMRSDEIHSIYFTKGAKVLFFEGPTKSAHSVILQPVVDGVVVPTFEVKDWMFRREAA